MEKVAVPRGYGARRLEDFFPGVRVRVDDVFRKILAFPEVLAPEAFVCEIVPIPISAIPDADQAPSQGKVISLLEYLGRAGSVHLAIPEGEEEVNLILGVWIHKGEKYVLFVEYEFEHGKREIHLHARKPEAVNDNNLLYVQFV